MSLESCPLKPSRSSKKGWRVGWGDEDGEVSNCEAASVVWFEIVVNACVFIVFEEDGEKEDDDDDDNDDGDGEDDKEEGSQQFEEAEDVEQEQEKKTKMVLMKNDVRLRK